MVFDFNIKVKEIDGKEGERNLCNILSDFIGSENKGNTVKLCYWYANLIGNKPLELDDPDKKSLIELITTTDRLYVFLKAQLLEVLQNN